MSIANPCIPIMQIQRGSLHDGPGVRTVVYTKGCNLHCVWCHNPESQHPAPQILFRESKCIGCGRCLSVCPTHHMATEDGEHRYVREGCRGCGACSDACPAEALVISGTFMTAEDVVRAVMRDAHYFAHSGGGVTFSGGECLLYPEFLGECLTLCRENGIHTAVETAFCVPFSSVESVNDVIDLFIIDIKHMDADLHRRYTGAGNAQILDNIRRIAAVHPHILLRTPLIPKVNDDMANLYATAEFVSSLDRADIRWELLKYNPLGTSKYEGIGREATLFADKPQDNSTMDAICSRLTAVLGEDRVFYR